jgi:internalin A
MNQEAIAIVQKCLETQDPYLDLGMLGLRDADFAEGTVLDKLLRQCTHLETLVLSNSWYLWGTDGKWTRHYSYNMGVLNQLGTHPPALANTTGLLILIIAGDYYNRWGISDMGFVAGLSSLQHLDLRNNQISEIRGLDDLSSLQQLNLGYNGISAIRGLGGLSSLQHLDLSGNRINRIRGLERLSSLQKLDLSSNPSIIEPLITLSYLSNLQVILLDKKAYINCQPYTELIETASIPLRVDEIENKTIVYITGSPIFPPPTIIVKGEAAIIAYFKSLQKGTQPLNEVKVLLVGDGAAGKTSLVKQLIGKAFDQKESQTHGIQIQDNTIRVEGEKIKVHYWDFGGQEIMHATHQFFLTKDCVYVLVLDGRKEERPEYWLKHIAVFGGNAPVLVILNKCDENRSYDIEQQELKQKFPNIQDYFKLSCKTQEGVMEFTRTLKQQLFDLPFRKTPFSPDWTNVKEQLRTMEQPYITYSSYYKICDDLAVKDPQQQQTLLDYLNSLGIILHFEQLKQYNTQVLNPLWLTQAVYRIVNSPIVAKQQGAFNEGQLCDILNDEHFINAAPTIEEDNDLLTKIKRWFGLEAKTKQPKAILYDGNIRLSFIAKVMQQFELSYCFDEKAGKYIIPDLLPMEPSVKINYGEYTLRFSTDFYFLPPALLPRFMVQTHLHIQDSIRWRNGVMLNAEGVFDAVAIVRVDKENKRLDIYVKGPEERELLAYIRSVLQGLYDGYEGLKEPGRIKEWLFLPDSDVEVEMAEIEGLSKRNKEEYSSGKTNKDYKVAELKASVENPAYPLEKEAQPVRIFISYSRTKKKFREELVTKLHLLTKSKDNFIELWVDEEMNPGVEWEKEIDDALHNCDIVICLLSDEYLASKVCMYEATKAKENGKIIYPILVNTCAWRDTFFSQINGYFSTPIEQVTKSKRPENWQQVYSGVVKLIKK